MQSGIRGALFQCGNAPSQRACFISRGGESRDMSQNSPPHLHLNLTATPLAAKPLMSSDPTLVNDGSRLLSADLRHTCIGIHLGRPSSSK